MLWNNIRYKNMLENLKKWHKSRVFLKKSKYFFVMFIQIIPNCSRCYISIFDGLVSILFVSFQVHILFSIFKNQAHWKIIFWF